MSSLMQKIKNSSLSIDKSLHDLDKDYEPIDKIQEPEKENKNEKDVKNNFSDIKENSPVLYHSIQGGKYGAIGAGTAGTILGAKTLVDKHFREDLIEHLIDKGASKKAAKIIAHANPIINGAGLALGGYIVGTGVGAAYGGAKKVYNKMKNYKNKNYSEDQLALQRLETTQNPSQDYIKTTAIAGGTAYLVNGTSSTLNKATEYLGKVVYNNGKKVLRVFKIK